MLDLKIVFVFITALKLQYTLDPSHIINVAVFFFTFPQHFSIDLVSFLILYISLYARHLSKKESVAHTHTHTQMVEQGTVFTFTLLDAYFP